VRKREVLASGLDKASLSKARAMGFQVISSANSPGSSTPVIALKVPEGMSEGAAQDWLEKAMPQARFGPNHVYHIYPASEVARLPAATKNAACQGADCLAKSLLDWKASLSSCARGVSIGVIDTSFDMSHPALKDRSYDLKDFRSAPMAPKSDWHGTAVLSVLAGDAQSATPGIVPAAHYLLAATFGAGPDGQASADAVSVLAALSWLDGKADIINMSFSGPRNDEIELAIRAMAVKGVVFVAAAGNRGPNGPASYPAAYSDVIAVTAVAQDKRGYRHATHGDYVDMAAPGVDVFTALPLGKTGLRTGTSFAAPFVTGLLAAMPAVRKGAMTKADVMARISTDDLGAPGRDPVFGEGLPKAPERCDEIGGIASLPWSPEAQRMSLGAGRTSVSQRSGRADPTAASAMGWAMGFAP
jgi:subtilisin family serine protease